MSDFAKSALQNMENNNIFFIFFAKYLQEFRKGYTFAVYYNNSTPQQQIKYSLWGNHSSCSVVLI